MKTSELVGATLDLWVARAEGKCATVQPDIWGNACINDLGRLSIAKGSWDCAKYFEPSKSWVYGGPIIERERIMLVPHDLLGMWRAYIGGTGREGSAPLIAAMRCYVASKFGETVPDEVVV